MSSLLDVSNSIKASVTDKTTHPLLGSFIISWLFFNWQAIYFLLFAELDNIYKLKAISENYSDIYRNLVLPLLSSLVLVFLLPLFTAAYIRFIARTKEFQIRSLPELFEHHSLTLEESNSLRNYYESEFKNLKNELDSATKEVTRYRTQDKKTIYKYKTMVNEVFDLFAAVKLDTSIINTQLTSVEVDKITFLEQFLAQPIDNNHLLSQDHYKAYSNKKLCDICFDSELIEMVEIEGVSNMIRITRLGIETLSDLKYSALNKMYDLVSPGGLTGRGLY